MKVRIFVDQALTEGVDLLITGNQHHYLTRVMRCYIGDELRIFNSSSGEWLAVITNINKATLALKILNILVKPKSDSAGPSLTLAFAPIKTVSPSFIAQKATELGVTGLKLINTTRTVVKVNPSYQNKLTAVVIEAAEQCERLDSPVIYFPIFKLKNFVEYSNSHSDPPAHIIAVCHPQKHNNINLSCNRLIDLAIGRHDCTILIGPEGGFTLEEIQLINSWHDREITMPGQGVYRAIICMISLGSLILRAETAAIFSLTLHQVAKELQLNNK